MRKATFIEIINLQAGYLLHHPDTPALRTPGLHVPNHGKKPWGLRKITSTKGPVRPAPRAMRIRHGEAGYDDSAQQWPLLIGLQWTLTI